ncbi:MAG: hypothetical protein JWN39_3042 [Ilumatobacteraceae bacterium]|nr:hypothetical protein [Ilumatobacteraceae bacterium]
MRVQRAETIRAAVSAARLRHLVLSEGGFTVRHSDGEPVENGISVCTRPSRSFAFTLCHWNDGAVDRWLADRSREYGWRSRCIGGWLDPRSDTVWLDVVRVVPPELSMVARLMGRATQQHCVFDLARRETVRLRRSAS